MLSTRRLQLHKYLVALSSILPNFGSGPNRVGVYSYARFLEHTAERNRHGGDDHAFYRTKDSRNKQPGSTIEYV
jgi:hypothetical protein